MPEQTLVHSAEATAPGRKISKDRITFMPCANADGTHKLPMVVLGHAQKPRCFKNQLIPIYYRANKNAWMTKSLFKEWFQSSFVPGIFQTFIFYKTLIYAKKILQR